MRHGDLRTGIQVIEGLVQNQDGRIHQHGGNDADFLAVAVGEVVDEFPGSEDFTVHERFKALQAGAEEVVRNAVALGHKTKELFRRIEFDKKTAVQIGPGEFFPGFVLVNALAANGYIATGSLNQVLVFLVLFQGVHLFADVLGPLDIGALRGKGLPGNGLSNHHLKVLALVAEKLVREGEHFQV